MSPLNSFARVVLDMLYTTAAFKPLTSGALQNILKGLRVPGIPAKDMTLPKLRKGMQQQPDKWVPAACALIRAAPAACHAALAADVSLVAGLVGHLAQACSGAAAHATPAAAWVEGAQVLSQLLTWGCPFMLAADSILPIYSCLVQIRAVAAVDITRYLFQHQTLAYAVLQHPTLLLDIIRQLGAIACHADSSEYSDLTEVLTIIITSQPAKVSAHGPFIAELQQLLAAGHAGAAHLLRGVIKHMVGRLLIKWRPELAVALAVSFQAPGAPYIHIWCGLEALVPLVNSPDSASALLSSPAFCQGLVAGLAAALSWVPRIEPTYGRIAWSWLQQLVCHEPIPQVMLTWTQQQGAEQGAAAPPPQAHPAAAGAETAGGSSSFLAALGAALQCLTPGAEEVAGTVLCTLLEAAPDQQQLLEALQVSSWLKSIDLQAMPAEAQFPWAQAVSLLLGQPAGRAALWAAPQLLLGVLRLALSCKQGPMGSRWRQLRDQVQTDAGYHQALLEGVRGYPAGGTLWMTLLSDEVSELTQPRDRHHPPAYSALQLAGLAEALAAACMLQGPQVVWWMLQRLLSTPAGQALVDAHPQLVTAVASLFARADGSLETILSHMDSIRGERPELRTYVLSNPQLLKGLVMGAVGASAAPLASHTKLLAYQPWFKQAVEGDGEVLDELLRALGPADRSHTYSIWGTDYSNRSCQEAVLAQLNKEALFPKLLQRLSSPGDVKLVQGAWNGLDWLRRRGPPWKETVPRALHDVLKAAARASDLPQTQLQVTYTAVQLAQEHAALREQLHQLEAAKAQLAAARSSAPGSATEAAVALPQQQEPAGAGQAQGGGRKRRPQGSVPGAAGGTAAAEVGLPPPQPGQKKARTHAYGLRRL
jgi:hypothetical protein